MPSKKTPAKGSRTPAKRSRAKSEVENSPLSGRKLRTPKPADTPRSRTSRLPTKEELSSNGRVVGRNLIRWSRPRMTEKLLLHIGYECVRHKISLPWDAIAHRLHPGSSGAAIQQHLMRLRRELIAEGHLVPPIPVKASLNASVDQEIRGYIRADPHGQDKESVKPVRFDDDLEDPRFNLPDAFMPNDDDDDDNDGVDAMHLDNPQVTGETEFHPSPPYRNISNSRARSALYNFDLKGEDPFEQGFDGSREKSSTKTNAQDENRSSYRLGSPPGHGMRFGPDDGRYARSFPSTYPLSYSSHHGQGPMESAFHPGVRSQNEFADEIKSRDPAQSPYPYPYPFPWHHGEMHFASFPPYPSAVKAEQQYQDYQAVASADGSAQDFRSAHEAKPLAVFQTPPGQTGSPSPVPDQDAEGDFNLAVHHSLVSRHGSNPDSKSIEADS